MYLGKFILKFLGGTDTFSFAGTCQVVVNAPDSSEAVKFVFSEKLYLSMMNAILISIDHKQRQARGADNFCVP